MKKFLSVTLLLVLTLALLLTGCKGQKAVEDIQLEGLKREYEINEKPDFSGVSATIVYNDGSTKKVGASELSFGKLDTSISGKKNLEVSYEGFTATYQVTVKSQKNELGSREVTSIQYFEGLPEFIYYGDIITYENIKIIVNYVNAEGEKTQETMTLGQNSAITHNGNDINTSQLGTQILTIKFMGKSVDVNITIKELKLVDLLIDSTTVDTSIYENQEFKTEGMVVKAKYNSGKEIQIPVADLTIERVGNVVTISYGGVTKELKLSYDTPYVESLNLDLGNQSKIVIGDTFNTSALKVTANMSNGTVANVNNDEVTFSIDASKVGDATLTCSYNAKPEVKATKTVTVLGIKSISIDTSVLPVQIKIGTALNVENLSLIITCSDDSIVTRSVKYGAEVNTAEKGTYKVSASYGGVSTTMSVIVYAEANYIISGWELPKKYTETGVAAMKELFINKNYEYVVGDDNPFIFKLVIDAETENGETLAEQPEYTSYSEVYYNGSKLADNNEYVSIDDTENAFDFTDAAVGKTFTIYTRPRFIPANLANKPMSSITVTVVDGFNIHEPWELNYLTNYTDTDRFDQRALAQTLINQKGGITIPDKVASFVIHNELIVTTSDIPSEYFVGGNPANGIWDCITIFPHTNDSPTKKFTFYGNYFTIFTHDIPNVCDPELTIGNQDDAVSNSQVFRFTNNNANGGNYDHTEYTTVLNSVYLRDDNPNIGNIQIKEEWTADQIAAYEKMIAARKNLGLISMKVCYQTVKVENIRVEAFLISFFADHDYLTVDINESIFFNAWQNHIFIFSDNPLQEDTETPRENYPASTVNITNSKLTKCGGPVIITQSHYEKQHSKSGAQVNLKENNEIWTWVTGSEPWFVSMGVSPIAQQMITLGLGIQQVGTQLGANNPPTIISKTNEAGETNGEGYFMNMIMVNLSAGTDPTVFLTGTHDIDGKLTINGTTYLDMNDGENGTYGDKTVSNNVELLGNVMVGGTIVNTCNGGAIVLDSSNNIDMTKLNHVGLTDGDYVAVYKGNLGIVFGYAPLD